MVDRIESLAVIQQILHRGCPQIILDLHAITVYNCARGK